MSEKTATAESSLTPVMTAEEWRERTTLERWVKNDDEGRVFVGPVSQWDYSKVPAKWETTTTELRVTYDSAAVDQIIPPEDYHKVIALANYMLPPQDRRKLGWDYVAKLQEIAGRILNDPDGFGATKELQQTADAAALLAIADILASYLPPREGANNDA